MFSGRNLLGGVFPLVTYAMFNNLGFPAASSLLGGVVSSQSHTIIDQSKSLINCRVRS